MNTRTSSINIRRLLVWLVIIHVAECLLAAGAWYALERQAYSTLARRLDLGSSPGAFGEYIETHFKIGMTREEIIRQAEMIGPYTIKPLPTINCENYYFNVGPLESRYGLPWQVCYDESGKVISVQAIGYQ